VYGSIAEPLSTDPAKRPAGISPDHTHRWTVYVKGVDDADISYWLRKVQFKLHETYAQNMRMVEAPSKFEVTETGWGEFEVGIKMWFVPEANEKAHSVYHVLKLHPYGEDKEAAKARGDSVRSEAYTEIVFNEPMEQFYNTLTSEGKAGAKAGKVKGGPKGAAAKKARDAEIPERETAGNPFSQRTEDRELDRLAEAQKQVETLLKEQTEINMQREEEMVVLKEAMGLAVKPK